MKFVIKFITLAGMIVLSHRPALALECVGSWDKPFHVVTAATITGGKGEHCIHERHNRHSTHVAFAFLIEDGSADNIRYRAQIYGGGRALREYKLTRVPNTRLWFAVAFWPSNRADQVAALQFSNDSGQPVTIKAAVSEIDLYKIAEVSFARTVATIVLSNALEQILKEIGIKISGQKNGDADLRTRLFDAVISTAFQELGRTENRYNLDRLVNAVFVALEFRQDLSRSQATFMNNFVQLALYDIFRGTLYKVDKPLNGKRVDWIWEHRTGFWEGDLLDAAGEGLVVNLKFLPR